MAIKSKSGLGRGLESVFVDNTIPGGSAGATLVPLSDIMARRDQPRSSFDLENLQELADSIAKNGLINPITVRESLNGYYEIIAGERRWRAAKMAGLSEVPVTILPADDRKAAELSIIENICVERKKWITQDEMMDITVIAESTPGPIAINCATYVGFKQGKTAGAVAAMMGMILPSFVIIFAISNFLDSFLEIAWIANAFRGIKVAVGILIVDAAVKMLKVMEKKPLWIGIAVFSFSAMVLISAFSLGISPTVLMLASALAALTVTLAAEKMREGRNG